MPALIFFAVLDLERNDLFLDRHELSAAIQGGVGLWCPIVLSGLPRRFAPRSDGGGIVLC